jgi:hypothetical protein
VNLFVNLTGAARTLIFVLPCALLLNTTSRAEEASSLGVAIVYDTSGSMHEKVPDKAGGVAPKYQIANRALLATVAKMEAFQKAHPERSLQVDLITFDGRNARVAVPFGKFDAGKLRGWLGTFSKPDGPTPLGTAIETAAEPLLGAKLEHRHVLVITDGVNTAGPKPEEVIPKLRRKAAGAFGFHFIAFDVGAAVFDPVKKLDATVVTACDENQLDQQLSFILDRKILLENEELPAKKP